MKNNRVMKIIFDKDKLLEEKQILEILKRYDLVKCFQSEKDIHSWISKLNKLQVSNLLSLNFDPSVIKFDTELLINKDLLNVTDYTNRVAALISIENADGWYHLFDTMLNPTFLNSPKFYQDIETLKRAECAQTPLWIIGEESFINSPYHDEDFELLVTAKDNSNKKLDFVLQEVIATIAGNADSINSQHHKSDLKMVIKYGSEALQIPHSYPERTIGYLAVNNVSLNDLYHSENMEILANNTDIGNFLYPIMTNKQAIRKPWYRRIIREMIEHKDNKYYAFMLCCYAVGLEKSKSACHMDEYFFESEISKDYDINEILEKIDEKLNVVECNYHNVTRYELESIRVKKKSLATRIENTLNRKNN